MERNRIYCMDCLEGMKGIEDASVDLVVTDPPFNCLTNWGKKEGREENRLNPAAWFSNDNMGEDEYLKFMSRVISQLDRVLKVGGSGYMFCDFKVYPMLFYIFQGLGLKVNNLLVWDKNMPGLGQNWRYCYELIIFFVKGEDYCWNGLYSPNIVTVNRLTSDKLEHPTQKPLGLIRKFLEFSSKDDDLILDPFMGSGTTAVACKQLGRDFIGFEISQKYVDIANKRLEQANLNSWFG